MKEPFWTATIVIPPKPYQLVPAPTTALVPRSDPSLPAPVQTLADIATDIRLSHDGVMAGLSNAAGHALKTGEYLLEAKAKRLKHGQLTDFITLDCGLKLSTGQMYMRLARKKGELNPLVAANAQTSRGLSQAQALKFLSSGAPKRKAPKKRKGDGSCLGRGRRNQPQNTPRSALEGQPVLALFFLLAAAASISSTIASNGST